MLKEIVSISGKPGLYKMISQGKNIVIVESLIDGKRIPAFTKDKIISLKDISIFTDSKEISLGEVLEKIKVKENGNLCSIPSKSDNDMLRNYMAEIVPDYDRNRVYPNDIRKIIYWYNILIDKQITDFIETSQEENKKPENEEEPNIEK